MSDILPPDVRQRLQDFVRAKKTGRLEIDIRGGHVVGARLTDAIPVQRPPDGGQDVGAER